ncbi:MAG: hypothetical protein NXH75_12380, partial [Halobacteriovoraceae bacterium]|nr:hypothetical protein [Halobacteriovoraceae bacterium]
YSETLSHIASEFEREPRPDQLGSEHGFNGQVNTFLSGSIEDFKIIGNIFDTNRGETEATFRNIGTWGEGAPLRHLNGRPLVYGNIASSICQVMGVESPTPKDHSLLKVWNGKIRTHTDELENIIS